MKTHQGFHSKRALRALLTACVWSAACSGLLSCSSSRPRDRLAIPIVEDRQGDDVNAYVHAYLGSPEMLPHERELLERDLELRTNWAIQRVQENGKMRVRAIHPPLQFTGDDAIDMSKTYGVLLVADDIPPGEEHNFLTEYDVRVGPDPSLAEVSLAASAKSLKEADLAYVEENLTRLQIDEVVLQGDKAEADSIRKNFGAKIEEAIGFADQKITAKSEVLRQKEEALNTQMPGNALAEVLKVTRAKETADTARKRIRKLQEKMTLNSAQSQLLNLGHGRVSGQIEGLNKEIATLTGPKKEEKEAELKKSQKLQESLSKGIEGSDTARKAMDEDMKTASSEQVAAEEEETKVRNKLQEDNVAWPMLKKLEGAVDAAKKELDGLEAEKGRLEALQRRPETLEAALAGNQTLQTFWGNMLSKAKDAAAAQDKDLVYPMRTAVSVRFRPQMLKQLKQVQIEVIRKKIPKANARKARAVTGDGASASPSNPATDLGDTLAEIRKVLLMRGSDVDPRSRQDYLEHITAELPVQFGLLAGTVVPLRKRDPDLNSCWDAFAEVPFVASVLTSGDPIGTVPDLASWETTEFIQQIDDARRYLAELSQLLDNVEHPPDANAANGNSSPNVKSSLSLIADGDLAVFRINVLRGVVTTTVFLLPHDGAMGLFGETFAEHFYIGQVTLRNPNDKAILVYGNTMRLIVRMGGADPDMRGEDGRPRRQSWWGTYQPLDYDAVSRILTDFEEKDWRKRLSYGLDIVSLLGSIGSAFTSDVDYNRGVAVFSGAFSPAVKALLEKDLRRYRDNFTNLGLNNIEEVDPGGSITRYVFLPKGPIYGDYWYDVAQASTLGWQAKDSESAEFGARVLVPVYIHNVRREEVYVEGKRILASDPLSTTSVR